MRVTVGAKTDTGRVREANQDSILVEAPLFGVADGMGGHLAGDVASATAVEVVSKMAKSEPDDPSKLPGFIKAANEAIWTKSREDSHLQGMGTTCTLALLKNSTAHLAHVGDSRAYLLRDGQLRQITEDHTLVERMVQEGRISREEAPHHPQRSIITRALGADQDVEVDTLEQPVQEGDRILICSDGLSSMLDDGAIAEALRSSERPQQIAERLIDLANEAGGEDNISVVILALGESAAGDGASTDAGHAAPAASSGAPDQRPIARAVTPVPDARLDPDLEEDEEDDSPRAPRRGLRWVFVTVVVLALLLGAGYVAARSALGNSWFLAADDQGEVVIYQGIPEDIVGFSFRNEEERTGLQVEDLCPFQQTDIESGIRAESLDEARRTASDLRDRSDDLNCSRRSKN